MAITQSFTHDGTAGTNATVANTGYVTYSGASIPQFVAGHAGTAIRFLESWAATGFFRGDSTDNYSRIYFKFPTLPSGNCVFLSVFDATGATAIGRLAGTSDGRVRILNGSTTVDETAAAAMAAGSWYYADWRVVSGSQEARIYNAVTGALIDTLTGAAAAATPGRYAVGLAHNGQRAGSPDLDAFAIGNDWIGALPSNGTISASQPRAVGGVTLAPSLASAGSIS